MAGTARSERFLGRQVPPEELGTVREIIATCMGLSRMELARTVCELLEWRRANGGLKARECREWLEELEAAGLVRLPEKQPGRPVGAKTSVPITEQGERKPDLVGSFRDVEPIDFERVTTADSRRLFRELVGRYHPLGHTVPFGAHVRYLVRVTRPERQVVAALQFSSAAWRMAARDSWIGWSDEVRARNLPRIAANSRFLILPWVHVRNLASVILSRAAELVSQDWKILYATELCLLETLVDAERYRGISYRAANWIELGETVGRGRMDRDHSRHGRAPKRLFVYPLLAGACRRLREP